MTITEQQKFREKYLKKYGIYKIDFVEDGIKISSLSESSENLKLTNIYKDVPFPTVVVWNGNIVPRKTETWEQKYLNQYGIDRIYREGNDRIVFETKKELDDAKIILSLLKDLPKNIEFLTIKNISNNSTKTLNKDFHKTVEEVEDFLTNVIKWRKEPIKPQGISRTSMVLVGVLSLLLGIGYNFVDLSPTLIHEGILKKVEGNSYIFVDGKSFVVKNVDDFIVLNEKVRLLKKPLGGSYYFEVVSEK